MSLDLVQKLLVQLFTWLYYVNHNSKDTYICHRIYTSASSVRQSRSDARTDRVGGIDQNLVANANLDQLLGRFLNTFPRNGEHEDL